MRKQIEGSQGVAEAVALCRPQVICAYPITPQTTIVEILLDAGVAVNQRYHHQLTAMMWAAGYGKGDTVQLLLDRGADPRLRDDRGKSALDIARETGHADVVELLNAKQQ